MISSIPHGNSPLVSCFSNKYHSVTWNMLLNFKAENCRWLICLVFYSLEETYEALRTFQILGVEKSAEISHATCPVVVEKLGSSSSISKDLFYALRVNSILGCEIDARTFEV